MKMNLAGIVVVVVIILIVVWIVVACSHKKHDHGNHHHGHKKSHQTNLMVPSKYATVGQAITQAISTPGNKTIVLEGQGPYLFEGAQYGSQNLSVLTIQAASSTEHMGTFYGHLSGGFASYGDQSGQTVPSTVSGVGPFSLSLAGSNTVITVNATNIGYPYGFGTGCVQVPSAIPGSSPSLNPDFTSLLIGDTIRWFDAATNIVSDHAITGITTTSLNVSPAIPTTTLIRGTGFTVRPRATIIFDANQVNLATLGAVSLIGVQLQQGGGGALNFGSQTSVKIQRSLSHVNVIGSSFYFQSPNTWMDVTNGVSPAQLVVETGSLLISNQSFIGPSSGLYAYGSSGTCEYSLWVNNQLGVALNAGSSVRFDFGEFVRCAIGMNLEGSTGYEAVWFTGCGIAMLIENGSKYFNSETVSGNSVPITIDGQGAGTGIILNNNSQLYTVFLRLADVPTQANTDGVTFSIPSGITNASTTISSNGVGNVGPLLSSIQFDNSWIAHTEC
jgi:hypothetical protein